MLVSSGGLGPEVNLLLRALTAPGAEQVLSLACGPLASGYALGLVRAALMPPVLCPQESPDAARRQ